MKVSQFDGLCCRRNGVVWSLSKAATYRFAIEKTGVAKQSGAVGPWRRRDENVIEFGYETFH
jgi:hypothetical protein